jgi:hypothetical protein
MQIAFSCTNCGRSFRKDSTLAGKKGRCKDCGHVFVIPAPARKPSPDTNTAILDDPFGLNDAPVVAQRALAVQEVEQDFPLPRRAKATTFPSKMKRRSQRGGRGEFFDGLPGFVYLVVAGVVAVTFLSAASQAIGPPYGGLVFLAATAISALALFLYGFVGITVVAFRGGVINGFLCWICPPYLIGYAYREWDDMKGAIMSYFASMGLIAFMGVAMPSVPGVNPGLQGGPANRQAEVQAPDLDGVGPPAASGPGSIPPERRRVVAPPGVQPPVMTNAITIIVSGPTDPAFSDKLTELVRKVSGGSYQLSSTGGGGRSTFSIGTGKAMSSQEFANQITWATVTRVSGPIIEIDASTPQAR